MKQSILSGMYKSSATAKFMHMYVFNNILARIINQRNMEISKNMHFKCASAVK